MGIYIFDIVMYLLSAVAYYAIFKKAEKNPVTGLIPFYREWVMLDVIRLDKRFFILALPLKVFGIASSVLKFFGVIDLMAIIPVSVIVLIGTLIYNGFTAAYLGDAFEKGTGFKAGLFFLPTIFSLILGFGKAPYIYNRKRYRKKKA